jgi:hypothetical protein
MLLGVYPGQDSSVSIGTCYRLDSLGIEFWWQQDFLHLSRPALGPPTLLYNGYWVFPADKVAGAWQ